MTPSRKYVVILQFVPLGSEVFAVVADEHGEIIVLPAEQLTVVDSDYL